MPSRKLTSPHFIGLIAGLGMFLSTLDTGITTIAMASLQDAFHTDMSHVVWTLTLYTLVLSSSIMFFGWLGDRVGRLRIFRYGMVVFALSSLLCGAATHLQTLIIFRGVQGLGAAMMQATAMSIVTTHVSKSQQLKVMGLFSMLIGLGTLMGPGLGGLMLSTLGWHWIFWVNLPFCLYGLWGCARISKLEPLHNDPINLVSLGLYGLLMTSLLMFIAQLSQSHHSLAALWSFGCLAVLSLVALALRERRVSLPIIPTCLFKRSGFVAPIAGVMANGSTTSVLFIVPPLYFQEVLHYPPWKVGLIALFSPTGVSVFSYIGAKLIEPWGVKPLMLIGISLMLLTSLAFTAMSVHWPLWLFCVVLFIRGIGAGVFKAPSIVSVMSQVDEYNQARMGAFIRTTQNAAISFGAAMVTLCLATGRDGSIPHLMQGFHYAWWFAVVMASFALSVFAYTHFFWDKLEPGSDEVKVLA